MPLRQLFVIIMAEGGEDEHNDCVVIDGVNQPMFLCNLA